MTKRTRRPVSSLDTSRLRAVHGGRIGQMPSGGGVTEGSAGQAEWNDDWLAPK